jgi:hypothetical protein
MMSHGMPFLQSIHTDRSVRETYLCTTPRCFVQPQPKPVGSFSLRSQEFLNCLF